MRSRLVADHRPEFRHRLAVSRRRLWRLVLPTRLRLPLAIWGVVAVFVAATAAAGLALELGVEREAIAEGEERAVRFVSGAEASLNRALIAADVLLADLAQALPSAETADGRVDGAAASGLLRGAVRQNLLYRDIVLLDDAGRVLAAAREETTRLGAGLPEGFARATLARSAPSLAISAPVLNFVSAERALYFARAGTLSAGQRVLVVAEAPLPLIAAILAQSVDIPGLVVTLERDDGQLLASVPPFDARLGQWLVPPLTALALTGAPVRANGRLDGAPSILVARPALYRSVRIAASIPLHAVLAGVDQVRRLIRGVVAAFVAMFLAAGAGAHWQLGRLARARRASVSAKNILVAIGHGRHDRSAGRRRL